MSQIMDGTKFNSTLNKKITQLKLHSSNYTTLIFFHNGFMCKQEEKELTKTVIC